MKVLLRFTALIPPILRQIPRFLISAVLECACDASILTDSHHCIFHVSVTLVLSHFCRMPIPHHFSQLYYWSHPSHFRILRSISIFFFLFADDYERMLSGSPLIPPQKKKKRAGLSFYVPI